MFRPFEMRCKREPSAQASESSGSVYTFWCRCAPKEVGARRHTFEPRPKTILAALAVFSPAICNGANTMSPCAGQTLARIQNLCQTLRAKSINIKQEPRGLHRHRGTKRHCSCFAALWRLQLESAMQLALRVAKAGRSEVTRAGAFVPNAQSSDFTPLLFFVFMRTSAGDRWSNRCQLWNDF